MSRVANQPISIPSGVNIAIQNGEVTVKGAKGQLSFKLHHAVGAEIKENVLVFEFNRESPEAKMHAGTARASIANMVQGVSQGFEKKLLLVGVGYRAKAQGSVLNLSLGFSHPVDHVIPQGIVVETPSQTEIILKGSNLAVLGQVAADIRSYRPPEPYKGKGIRYANEKISLKETKKK